MRQTKTRSMLTATAMLVVACALPHATFANFGFPSLRDTAPKIVAFDTSGTRPIPFVALSLGLSSYLSTTAPIVEGDGAAANTLASQKHRDAVLYRLDTVVPAAKEKDILPRTGDSLVSKTSLLPPGSLKTLAPRSYVDRIS